MRPQRVSPYSNCCDTWGKIKDSLVWFDRTDIRYCKNIPCIELEGKLWRVRFCPSCGCPVRGLVS